MKRQIWGIVGFFCIGIFAVCGAEVNAEASIVGAEEEMTIMPGDGEARMRAVGAGQVADNAERIEMSAEGATNLSLPAPNLGTTCYAMCTVTNLDPKGWCPASIRGTGATTLQGECPRACNKADGNAAIKLPPGCLIKQCTHTGC
jgi:hypothetical protein